tara:strand:+ start:543 stop:785 length:243 start_codon:yes stop_codon:yes gene_type:complete
MIPEKEFREWLEHPVTRDVKKFLASRRETLRQDWEGGSFTDYTSEGVALTNVGNIGLCRGYAAVMDLTYEELVTELDNGK